MEPSIPVEAGSIHGANDAPAAGHAREWWERYIPLLIPLLLVTIYLAYIWLSYPDLMPVFLAWMVLITVALWFVYVRVMNKSKAPDRNVSPLRVRKRWLAGAILMGGANMALLATLQVLLGWFFKDYTFTSKTILIFAFASFVFTTLFVVLWAGTSPNDEWRLGSFRSFVAIIAVITLIATGAAFAGYSLGAHLDKGPPASWTDLLHSAQREAEKIDRDAMAEIVRARPPYSLDPPYSPQSTAFEVEFSFATPNATGIRVEVLDTDPPRLRSVESQPHYPLSEDNRSIPPEILSGYAAKLAYVKLSPRDAYRITEQEGLDFAQQIAPGQPLYVDVHMFLNHDWQEQFGVPAGWNVTYSVDDDKEYKRLTLRVDGASGRIVDREQP